MPLRAKFRGKCPSVMELLESEQLIGATRCNKCMWKVAEQARTNRARWHQSLNDICKDTSARMKVSLWPGQSMARRSRRFEVHCSRFLTAAVVIVVVLGDCQRHTPLGVSAATSTNLTWGGKGCGACVPTCIGDDKELDCGMRRLAVEYATALLGQVRRISKVGVARSSACIYVHVTRC